MVSNAIDTTEERATLFLEKKANTGGVKSPTQRSTVGKWGILPSTLSQLLSKQKKHVFISRPGFCSDAC